MQMRWIDWKMGTEQYKGVLAIAGKSEGAMCVFIKLPPFHHRLRAIRKLDATDRGRPKTIIHEKSPARGYQQ
jgi:hypothetical protein